MIPQLSRFTVNLEIECFSTEKLSVYVTYINDKPAQNLKHIFELIFLKYLCASTRMGSSPGNRLPFQVLFHVFRMLLERLLSMLILYLIFATHFLKINFIFVRN